MLVEIKETVIHFLTVFDDLSPYIIFHKTEGIRLHAACHPDCPTF